MKHRLWMLGAPSPEMGAVEALLRMQGEEVTYAAMADGFRVTPGAAYTHDPVIVLGTEPEFEVIAVECDGAWRYAGSPRTATRRIDHHRPGDPGYGQQPAWFLPASSIGQVVLVLAELDRLPAAWRAHGASEGRIYFRRESPILPHNESRWSGYVIDTPTRGWVEIPEEIVLAAAADHCLAAAYRGECPGVDPDTLMHWRAASRAAFQGRTVEALLEDVERTRGELASAPSLRDLRGVVYWTADDPRLIADLRGPVAPELPEAAARDGQAYLAGPFVERDGRRKFVLGAASPEQVTWFLTHGGELGLRDCYGDPARGFAGGYYDE